MIVLHSIYRNPGQNLSGLEISGYSQILKSKKGSKTSKNLSCEKYQNGSHSKSVPYKPFKTLVEKRQQHSLPQLEILM